MRLLIKFGGTSIKNEERIREAARNIAKIASAGNQVIVVVSAQGDMTNKLINKARRVSGKRGDSPNFLEFIAMGEKMSSHLFSLALSEIGQKAFAITQDSDTFPLVSSIPPKSDDETASVKTNELKSVIIDEEATSKKIKKHITPMLADGVIPVVAGFVIKDANNKLVTLGRGGSDITAFLLGKYARCDEVIIVTDVPGVLSSDPNKVDNALLINELSANDLALLAKTGAQVIHPNALRFKDKNQIAKIVHYSELENFQITGTSIVGRVNTQVTIHNKRLVLFTFIGRDVSRRKGLMAELSSWLFNSGYPIHSISTSRSFVSIYMNSTAKENLYKKLHHEFIEKTKMFDCLNVMENVGEITLSNHIFVETPGIISMISNTLANERINIIEMVTAHTDIVIYVSHSLLSRTFEVLRSKFIANR